MKRYADGDDDDNFTPLQSLRVFYLSGFAGIRNHPRHGGWQGYVFFGEQAYAGTPIPSPQTRFTGPSGERVRVRGTQPGVRIKPLTRQRPNGLWRPLPATGRGDRKSACHTKKHNLVSGTVVASLPHSFAAQSVFP